MPGTDGAKPERVLRLVALRDDGMQIGRELSADEESSYVSALSVLREHDRAAALGEMARRNLAALKESVREIGLRIPRTPRAVLQREAEIELNRHFLNVLAAMRQFLDHTEARLKRAYRSQPGIYEDFKRATAQAYDGVFAYRFLYKLRNYGQHCGAPIGQIELESSAIGNSSLVEHKVHLRYDPVQLLTDGGDVWGKLRPELERRRDKFDALPLAEEVITQLDMIWSATRTAERGALEALGRVAVDILSLAPRPNRIASVVRIWHRKKSSVVEFHHPPAQTMIWLGYGNFRDPL